MNLEPPQEFKVLCRNLTQDLSISSADQMVQYALLDIGPRQGNAIRQFLDQKLLSGAYSPDEIRTWWWSTPSSITFYDSEGLMMFLKLIREALDKPPFSATP